MGNSSRAQGQGPHSSKHHTRGVHPPASLPGQGLVSSQGGEEGLCSTVPSPRAWRAALGWAGPPLWGSWGQGLGELCREKVQRAEDKSQQQGPGLEGPRGPPPQPRSLQAFSAGAGPDGEADWAGVRPRGLGSPPPPPEGDCVVGRDTFFQVTVGPSPEGAHGRPSCPIHTPRQEQARAGRTWGPPREGVLIIPPPGAGLPSSAPRDTSSRQSSSLSATSLQA